MGILILLVLQNYELKLVGILILLFLLQNHEFMFVGILVVVVVVHCLTKVFCVLTTDKGPEIE